MKIGGVRGVHGVSAEAASRSNDPQRRAFLEQGSDLNRRGVRTQDVFFLGLAGNVFPFGVLREIKRILRVPRRVVFRSVQGIEAIPLGFNFSGFRNGEADFSKNRDDPSPNVGQGVYSAAEVRDRGEGRINLLTQRPEIGLLFDTFERILEEFLDPLLGLVESLTESRTIFLGQRTHVLCRLRQDAVGS